MDLNSFKSKKITIMGLGLHGGGVGVAKFFCKLGARVLVTDLKSKRKLAPSLKKLKNFKIEYVLGRHRKKDFKTANLIIKNPAVSPNSSFLEIARKNKIPIENQTNLFFKLCPGEIIGVTGTKGKSTVATLIYKLLTSEYKKVILAGNIGVPVLEKLREIDKNTIVVLELSSFQIEDLKKSPKIAVITNILEDHLNRYKNIKEYAKAKERIFRYQGPEGFLILNYDNKRARSLAKKAKGKVYFFSRKKPFKTETYLKGDEIFFGNKEICKTNDIKLKGRHNIENILAAVTVAKIKKVPSEKIRKVLKRFRGLPSRLEFVKKINGVFFYNDTCATNPQATIAALNAFKNKVILIAGGAEKNLCFEDLSKEILEKVKVLVLLEGEATERLKRKLKEVSKKSNKVLPIKIAKSMKEAINFSFKIVEKNDIVLLSPACSSFGMFLHEFDRGKQFNKAVMSLEKKGVH